MKLENIDKYKVKRFLFQLYQFGILSLDEWWEIEKALDGFVW
jgi:hypothetical protein